MKIFKQKILPLKSYSIFLLSTFIQKGLYKFIKPLPNRIQIPATLHVPFLCYHQGISVPRMAIEIGSYLSFSSSCKIISRHQCVINITLFLFYLLHLLQPPKCNSRSGMPITGVTLFYNQVVLLTCQGHTFT
jgi:hypothetical protein